MCAGNKKKIETPPTDLDAPMIDNEEVPPGGEIDAAEVAPPAEEPVGTTKGTGSTGGSMRLGSKKSIGLTTVHKECTGAGLANGPQGTGAGSMSKSVSSLALMTVKTAKVATPPSISVK